MRRYLLILLCLMAAVTAAEARRYLVCVGIADYPGQENDLKLSAQDAQTIRALYEKNGDATTELFTDANATRANVVEAVERLFARADSTDQVIFFFSGHGMQGCFVCHDGLLTYNTLLDAMAKSSAGTKIVMADACFAGKMRATKRKKSPESSVSDREVMFFLSSRSDEKSIERRHDWRNSLFTGWVERGLRGGADDDRDRTITAIELFRFVSKGVAETSQQKQHPVMWGKFRDDMPLMVWKK